MRLKHPRPKWMSFFLEKCPRCGKGPVFLYSVFHIFKFTETHSYCSKCALNYEPETGFFFGAMYWSYAMLVGLAVITAISGTYLGLGEMLYWGIPSLIVVLLPWIFRYSRMLMLYVVYPIMHKNRFEKKGH